ncbi:MAG: hypothetical protein AAFZ52_11200 [Bacteroidota bacterium]
MPEMRKEFAPRAVNFNAGDVTLETTPPTAGTVKDRRWDTDDTDIVLPAGAYSVHIRHVDPQGGDVAVNGETLQFNDFFSRQVWLDEVNNRQDFTPEVTVANPLGRRLSLSVSYPSSSPVNPDQL